MNYKFDSKKRLIEAMKKVNVDMVNKKLEQVFFSRQRRLNLKLSSDQHEVDEEAVKANQAFYEKTGTTQRGNITCPKLFRKRS